MRRFVLAVAFLGLAGVTMAQAAPRCSVSINGQVWQVEFAQTPRERERGLMFRQSMAAAHGMLFRFDDAQHVSMWMKNTFIPLDMVFISNTGDVAHIHRGAVPLSLETIASGVPVRFVLEVNAGEALAAGVAQGQRVTETCTGQ